MPATPPPAPSEPVTHAEIDGIETRQYVWKDGKIIGELGCHRSGDMLGHVHHEGKLSLTHTDKLTETQARLVAVGSRLIETLLRKNADYGNSAHTPPVLAPDCTPEQGLRVRMSDKIQRIAQLTTKEPEVISESLADTMFDLGGYCILYLTLPKESRRPLTEEETKELETVFTTLIKRADEFNEKFNKLKLTQEDILNRWIQGTAQQQVREMLLNEGIAPSVVEDGFRQTREAADRKHCNRCKCEIRPVSGYGFSCYIYAGETLCPNCWKLANGEREGVNRFFNEADAAKAEELRKQRYGEMYGAQPTGGVTDT